MTTKEEVSSSQRSGGIELRPNGGGDYYRALHDDHHGASAWNAKPRELRVHVFKEAIMLGKVLPSVPRYNEARPVHFPPEITVFHTGALHSFVETKAMANFTKEYDRVRQLAMVGCLIGLLVFVWTCPTLLTGTDGDDPTMVVISIYVATFVCAALIGVVAHVMTRSAVNRLHDRMEVVVAELSPVFRRAGYDLAYCPSSSFRGRSDLDDEESERGGPPTSCLAQCGHIVRSVHLSDESFVRIVPFQGPMTQEELDRADAIWAPSQPSVELAGFRVALCGSQVQTVLPKDESAVQEPSFLSLDLPEATQKTIDAITWATLVSELRSCTEAYQRIRLRIVSAALACGHSPIYLAASINPPLWLLLVMLGVPMLGAILFITTPTAFDRWMMKGVLEKARIKVHELSPLVEERTGYSLWMQTEADGWLGGTAAYVHFEPGVASRDNCTGTTGSAPLPSFVASQPRHVGIL